MVLRKADFMSAEYDRLSSAQTAGNTLFLHFFFFSLFSALWISLKINRPVKLWTRSFHQPASVEPGDTSALAPPRALQQRSWRGTTRTRLIAINASGTLGRQQQPSFSPSGAGVNLKDNTVRAPSGAGPWPGHAVVCLLPAPFAAVTDRSAFTSCACQKTAQSAAVRTGWDVQRHADFCLFIFPEFCVFYWIHLQLTKEIIFYSSFSCSNK